MWMIDEEIRQETGRLIQLAADDKLDQEALALALQINANQEKAMRELHDLDKVAIDDWTRGSTD